MALTDFYCLNISRGKCLSQIEGSTSSPGAFDDFAVPGGGEFGPYKCGVGNFNSNLEISCCMSR